MKVCILTIIKDERDYLSDFLKYHKEMGLEIFIFQDLFSCSHEDICSKYDNVFLHSVKELYEENEQETLYENRLNKSASQTDFINRGLKYIHDLNKYDWVFLTDIDEYITCTEKFPDILERYKDYDAVSLYWKNFGPSGHIYKPVYDKPIYEIYTETCGYELKRDFILHNINKFCVNMRKYNPDVKWHIHNARANWVKVDFTYKRSEIVFEPLYLRHYITKSVEEYCWKVWVRGMHHQKHRDWQSLFEMCPEIKDKLLADKNFRPYFKEKYEIELPEY